jgi:hypothetical protein
MKDGQPLAEYKPAGYVVSPDGNGEKIALDAAVRFTATRDLPPFSSSQQEAGEWWREAYVTTCSSFERAIVRTLVDVDGVEV